MKASLFGMFPVRFASLIPFLGKIPVIDGLDVSGWKGLDLGHANLQISFQLLTDGMFGETVRFQGDGKFSSKRSGGFAALVERHTVDVRTLEQQSMLWRKRPFAQMLEKGFFRSQHLQGGCRKQGKLVQRTDDGQQTGRQQAVNEHAGVWHELLSQG